MHEGAHGQQCEHSHKNNSVDSGESKRYAVVLLLAVIIFIAEIAVGTIGNSLALVGDAYHVLADGGAIALALLIALFVKDKAPKHVSHIRKRGAFIQILLLFGVSAWIFFEAIARLHAPYVRNINLVIIVAILGTIGNYLQHKIVCSHGSANTITKRALSLHILSDLAQSIVVIISSIVIAITGFAIIDPILSIGIAIWMFIWTMHILKDTCKGEEHHCCKHK